MYKRDVEKLHIERHRQLHKALDELAADFMDCTKRLVNETSVLELMQWSYQQTESSTERLKKTRRAES